MMTPPTTTCGEQTLHAALELGKNSWLLALQSPGRDNPSLHPIRGGDADGLIAKLDAVRDRLANVSGQVPKVVLCDEAGYDGFWLVRLLEQRGIECLVMEPANGPRRTESWSPVSRSGWPPPRGAIRCTSTDRPSATLRSPESHLPALRWGRVPAQ